MAQVPVFVSRLMLMSLVGLSVLSSPLVVVILLVEVVVQPILQR